MAEYNPTYFDYIGDAVTKQFPINFSYITVDEVHVTVDSAPVSFSVESGFVVLPTAPGVGAEVRVLRSTDVRDPKHVFQHGSPLLPGPLDENFRQTLYAVEEAVHTSQDASGVADYAHQLAEQAILDSAHAVSDAAAAVATAGTADQKADSAVAMAGSAASTATNALSIADTAINTANAATSTANAASSTAGTALSTANAATTAANSANSTATQAELKADVAISTANTASSAASAATSTANAADLKATQAVTTADTADTKADTAVSTANSASSTAGAAQTAADSAVSVANAIDGKAQTALDNSVDAVGRVGYMEDIVGNLQAGGVSSFNGRVGSVLPTAGDYSVDDIEGLELALAAKLEASDISSNLTYYMTTAASGVAGYAKLVRDTHDPDFSSTAIVYESDAITGEDIPLGAFCTTPGIKDLHLDNLTMTIAGQLRKDDAGKANAAVRFEVYTRSTAGVEELIGSSGWSSTVTLATFFDIHMSAIIPHVQFELGDRLVIKYFAKKVGTGTGPKLRYKVGGSDPMRALLPVPVTAMIPDLPELAQAQVENAYSTVFGLVSGQRLSQAITALGLKIGTTGTTAAAGNDSRITGSAQKSANLSDLSSAPAARQNLGLGTAATRGVVTSEIDQTAGALVDTSWMGIAGYLPATLETLKDSRFSTGVNLQNGLNGNILSTHVSKNSSAAGLLLIGESSCAGKAYLATNFGLNTSDIDDIQFTELVSSLNLMQSTGQSTQYPMTQKAVTDALNTKVGLTGNQTVAGTKTFSSFPVTPSSAPTDNYQAANKKYVDDSAIGVGQTWQDVTGSRVEGTTYTNNTGKPIMVSVSHFASGSASNTPGVTGYVGDVLVQRTALTTSGGSAGVVGSSISILVPSGATYRILLTGKASNRSVTWAELR